ncbi:hypothetical protein HS962_01445 [Pantoea sp. BIGb0393]|uniref:Uncharacterized protein n=1 Tax=Pantoea nemavictus TaxID=2726955 RepID=A0ABU8PMC3_9GAMM|nr:MULTISPECIES: hypothetical protein [Pantoea]EJL81379.1 hypothetical protein PMI17_04966 [Pantoea sp. GM01]MBA0034907.1 hypothetical protein [Pantoea nemavictus]
MIRSSLGQLNSFNTRSTLRGISSLKSNLSSFKTSFSFNLSFFTGARLRFGADAHHSQWLETAYKEAR